MGRNVTFRVIRGVKANMPTLLLGELYLATDENQMYVGTNAGNQLLMLAVTSVPTGSGGGVSAPAHKTGDPGPALPQKIVSYAKVIIGGSIFWVPLMQ